MNDCCSSDKPINKFPRKQTCPSNKQDYTFVPIKTVLHHINYPWEINLKNQGYYFCNDPKCDIVYFGEDNSVIKKYELRTKVAAKGKDDSALACYCFGVSIAEAKNNSKTKDFVIQQTKLGNCSCETSNPSGRCCLNDFP